MEKVLNEKINKVPKDVITDADEQAAIKAHYSEEEATERRLGNKFKVSKIEDGGSSLSSQNFKREGNSKIDQFWSELETEYGVGDED